MYFILIAIGALGILGFFVLYKYSAFLSKYLAQLVIGIPLLALGLVPTFVLTLPFLDHETTDVDVVVLSVDEYRNQSFQPGKHGRNIQLFYRTLTLSAVVDGETITDTWAVPFGFGPFEEGQRVDGIMTLPDDGTAPQLAVRSVIRFPFNFSQLVLLGFVAIVIFITVAMHIGGRPPRKRHR